MRKKSALRLVLIVEDNLYAQEALADLLRSEGYAVQAAPTSEAALEYLGESVLPSLILLDLNLPGMCGSQFRRRLLADRRLAQIPVVITTGSQQTIEGALELGVAGYLTKPYSVQTLLETVAAHTR